jgi:hypothetical protein
MLEKINSDQTIRECSKILGHQVENIPELDTSKIVLTAECNPKLLRRINILRGVTATNSTSATIYTTPTDKDFYLTSALLSTIKDVTSTSTLERLRVVIDGVTQDILLISSLSLTAQDRTITLSLNNSIKIDRGTTITVTNSTNVANITTTALIQGYFVEDSGLL